MNTISGTTGIFSNLSADTIQGTTGIFGDLSANIIYGTIGIFGTLNLSILTISDLTVDYLTTIYDASINGITVGKGGGNTENFSTAVGYKSLSSNDTGFDNTAVGHNSLTKLEGGGDNTAVGSNSLPIVWPTVLLAGDWKPYQ